MAWNGVFTERTETKKKIEHISFPTKRVLL